jgi:AAA+ ATPase superfamily predicted ATPase
VSSRADPVIDREEPRGILRELLTRPGPSVALVYGRRRVGKTFLLNHTWPGARTFYFVAAKTTEAVNRVELIDAVNRQFGLSLAPEDYPSWRTIFRLLLELGAPEPLAVVLDEFQYLVDADPSIPSQLTAVLDVHRDRRPFVVALSGSVVRTMEQLAAGGAPLYGRLAASLLLAPFDYLDAAAMMPFPDGRSCAIAYGIYGGTPQYLASLRPGRSLAENVAADVLAPGGQVHIQIESVIYQERGLRNTEAYRAILRAVASGRTQVNDIARYAAIPVGTPLRQMLDTLVELGYLAAGRNFGAARNAAYRYRLADPALRFHAALVELYRSELARNAPLEVWEEHIAGHVDTYMGLVFERIAEQAYQRRRAAERLPMVEEWGRWEGVDRTGAPREIDVVARLSDGHMLTGAVKWGGLDLGVHNRHLRALEALAASGQGWAREALDRRSPLLYVTGESFSPDFVARAEADGHRVLAWTLDELYAGRTSTGNGPRQHAPRDGRDARR